MSNPDVPPPLTREQFEAGEAFCIKSKHDPYHIDIYKNNQNGFIIDKKGQLYCAILYNDERSFTFCHFIFEFKLENKIYFKNCFKAPKK